MHIQSQTIRGHNGLWYNVYGVSHAGLRGTPLKPMFSFEKLSYGSREEAVTAARKRSQMEREAPTHRPVRDPFPSSVGLEDILSLYLQSLIRK